LNKDDVPWDSRRRNSEIYTIMTRDNCQHESLVVIKTMMMTGKRAQKRSLCRHFFGVVRFFVELHKKGEKKGGKESGEKKERETRRGKEGKEERKGRKGRGKKGERKRGGKEGEEVVTKVRRVDMCMVM